MTARRTAIIALTLLLTGCVPSLSPLYTKDDLLEDPRPLGKWISTLCRCGRSDAIPLTST
jgi:hypothetical protein